MKRNPYLKVKLKSLAAEARLIRIEERIANNAKDYQTQNRLHDHRTGPVRRAARETLLAYQFLRGMPYAACESPETADKNPPSWDAVHKMIKRYGAGQEFDPELWTKPTPELSKAV